MYSLFLLARMHCILPGPHAHCIHILKPLPSPFSQIKYFFAPLPLFICASSNSEHELRLL